MSDTPRTQFFLGANSPSGFYSLYDDLLPPESAAGIYILKGGPGCGKSTLMRRVAARCQAFGQPVEYILCSGDPASLDAIVLPRLRIAIVDGTAPHVVEPKYPGLVEQYVNMGDCYDKTALASVRESLFHAMDGYSACYARAYRCLAASAGIREDLRSSLLTPALEAKLQKRARGILKREVKPVRAQPGQVKKRFLSAVTPGGPLCLFSTVETLADRVYALQDSYGLSHSLLAFLFSGAAAAGYDVIACPSPMAPERLEHLIIPELSLAFLTSSPEMPYEGKAYRRLRLDSMADRDLVRRSRPRLRFARRVADALMEEACASLAEAKAKHDALEAVYHPYVDFKRGEQLADSIAAEILSLPQGD